MPIRDESCVPGVRAFQAWLQGLPFLLLLVPTETTGCRISPAPTLDHNVDGGPGLAYISSVRPTGGCFRRTSLSRTFILRNLIDLCAKGYFAHTPLVDADGIITFLRYERSPGM